MSAPERVLRGSGRQASSNAIMASPRRAKVSDAITTSDVPRLAAEATDITKIATHQASLPPAGGTGTENVTVKLVGVLPVNERSVIQDGVRPTGELAAKVRVISG